jgi:RimJ/RimL family protein N-acetyltransferase
MPITNPLLHDFPEEFHTERLTIRAPRAGDGTAINAGIVESHAELKPWMPWSDPIPSPDDSETNVREAAAQFILRRNLRLHAFFTDTGEFVASTGLHNLNWPAGAFEIGYWIRTSLSGQGLVTEAVCGIVQFAADYLDARRLQICCDANNVKSRRVAERAGFHLESLRLGDDVAADGSRRDTLVFALLRLDDHTWGYPETDRGGCPIE